MGRQQNLIYENFAFARCVLKNLISNKRVIMLRNDLFKFLVLFVFVISLVSMVGCGDDDDDGGLGSDPCGSCPCEYFDVPLSRSCWDVFAGGPVFADKLEPDPENCVIIMQWQGNPMGFGSLVSGPEGCAVIPETFPTGGCNVASQKSTDDMIEAACNECLEQYANDLNGVFPVAGQQPFTCTASQ